MSILLNNRIDISDFLRLTNAGLRVADFTQIRSAIIDRYKEIYGSDIDLSTASADGVFVNNISLIINNILQTINTMYANLDISTASGVYLDTLCALANVTRRQATNSTASVLVTNTSNASITLPNNASAFVDRAGNEWAPSKEYTIGANSTVSVDIYCMSEGSVSAPAGWINQSIDASLVVQQNQDAVVGRDTESDASLRARHSQSAASSGTTTLSALCGALLDINGIEDVYVVNNNTGDPETQTDGVDVAEHSIYVVIRQKEGISVDASTIGTIIYEKLTPGIPSTDATGCEQGTPESFEYVESVAGYYSTDLLQQNVYWKKATPIVPTITIDITTRTYFSTDELGSVAMSVNEWINSLSLGQAIDANEVVVKVLEVDPRFKGMTTYTLAPSDVSISNATNKLSYYNLTTYGLKWNGSVSSSVMTDGEFELDSKTFRLYKDRVQNVANASEQYKITNNKFTYDNVEYEIVVTSITKDTSKYRIYLA